MKGNVKVVRDNNRFPDLVNVLEELQRTEIHIGIFGSGDSHLLMIANVHEYGVTIKPKKAKRLAVPLNKKARERSPRSFNDLWPLKAADGALYLVRDKGSNEIEFMYWLATSVTIPERAFIRGGFDANANRFSQRAVKLLKQVISGRLDIDGYFDLMGDFIVGELQAYMTNLQDPPNSTATTAAKGRSNPLIDTGRLRDAITYRVVKV